MATTASHHVTTLFGMVLFIGPIALHSLRVAYMSNPEESLWAKARGLIPTLWRGLILGGVLVSALVITVFAYWYWSLTDPITQVPIPHSSRESFIERLDLGFIFFLLPWGISLLALPYVFYKAFSSRLWPLGLSILLCFVLGTGGTTPIPKIMLGGAFDILTLDRFTFWGSILMLPILGFGLDRLIFGPLGQAIRGSYGGLAHRTIIASYFIAVVAVALFAAVLPTMRPTQPDPIDAVPITTFMERDEHDRWRYLTLGFGDQFALISAKTTALSVDGNYHSARRLPELTSYAVERLENAKYLGVPGLGSLQQFLINAQAYNLKYVFSNDAFYDPLLFFSGWTPLRRLPEGLTIWEKPDVPPLPALLPRREISETHTLMWTTIPPAALILAALLLAYLILRGELTAPRFAYEGISTEPAKATNNRALRFGLLWLVLISFAGMGIAGVGLWTSQSRVPTAQQTIEAFMDDLDFRRFEAAHTRLDPETRPDFEAFLFQRLWVGGLVNSYGKLNGLEMERIGESKAAIDWRVTATWLTALGEYDQELRMRTVRREDGRWYLINEGLSPQQAQSRIDVQADAAFNLTGHRQPRLENDVYRDILDRPTLAIHSARLVKAEDRFALVGGIFNTDADPAFLTLEGKLRDKNDRQLSHASLGTDGVHRLLPSEAAGFRIDFEGVLSLQDAEEAEAFDPTFFIPPEFEADPVSANLEARALAHGQDLYRGIALTNLRLDLEDGDLEVSGRAFNGGPTLASITRLTFYDLEGLPLWVEARYLEANLIPGQDQGFRFDLPQGSNIEVISEIPTELMSINGSGVRDDQTGDIFRPSGLIPLPAETGYSGVHIHLSSLTYDPLF